MISSQVNDVWILSHPMPSVTPNDIGIASFNLHTVLMNVTKKQGAGHFMVKYFYVALTILGSDQKIIMRRIKSFLKKSQGRSSNYLLAVDCYLQVQGYENIKYTQRSDIQTNQRIQFSILKHLLLLNFTNNI